MWSESAATDGITVDATGPTAPYVLDDGDEAYGSELHFLWDSSTDNGSGVAEYWYAIGTSVGATDLIDWTYVGIANEIIISTLSLIGGVLLYSGSCTITFSQDQAPIPAFETPTFINLFHTTSDVTLLNGYYIAFGTWGGDIEESLIKAKILAVKADLTIDEKTRGSIIANLSLALGEISYRRTHQEPPWDKATMKPVEKQTR